MQKRFVTQWLFKRFGCLLVLSHPTLARWLRWHRKLRARVFIVDTQFTLAARANPWQITSSFLTEIDERDTCQKNV